MITNCAEQIMHATKYSIMGTQLMVNKTRGNFQFYVKTILLMFLKITLNSTNCHTIKMMKYTQCIKELIYIADMLGIGTDAIFFLRKTFKI